MQMIVKEIPRIININRGTWSKTHVTRTIILEQHNKDTSYQHNRGVTVSKCFVLLKYIQFVESVTNIQFPNFSLKVATGKCTIL